ncbi:MAG: type II secretion system F family protein [Myxococcaceae bacterium]|nr:type II secretion system F family protein [Myxococcaceae bacterium]
MALWSKNLLSRWTLLRKQEVFYRQFHALVRAGVPLPTAFVQLRAYAPSEAFAAGLSVVAQAVARGQTLAAALEAQPHLFDPDQVELLSAAEQAGTLDKVTAALAKHLEEVRRLRWQAFMSSIWPAYLLGTLIFIGPLVGVASQSQVRSLGQVGGAYVAGLVPLLLVGVSVLLTVVFLPVAIAAFGAERQWDAFALRLPGVGSALRSLAASRALLTLGLSLSAGLEIARAVRVAVISTGRPSLASKADAAVASIRQGGTLFDALNALSLFDRNTIGQLGIAETTGTLGETLERLAPEVHEETLRAVRLLTLVIAGLIAVLALGFIVKGLLATLFGPIKTYYDLAGQPTQ